MDIAYINRILDLLGKIRGLGCKETIFDLKNNQVLKVSFIDFDGDEVIHKVSVSDFEFDYLLEPKERLEMSLMINLIKYENYSQMA